MEHSEHSMPVAGSTGMSYLLETYSDRDRLFLQYELFRDDFNHWFDRALRLGNLSTDPATATWRVLDVGCGEGLFAHEIATRYPRAHIIGFDTDAVAIGTAALTFGRSTKHDLQFYTYDACLPLPPAFDPDRPMTSGGSGFDVALAHIVLPHIRAFDQALRNLRAALKPGGVLYVRDIDGTSLRFPHPSLVTLWNVFVVALQQIAGGAFTQNHADYLAHAGFTPITSGVTTYPIGGTTPAGQQMLGNFIRGFPAARRAVVERQGLMRGPEFDAHFQRLMTEITPELVGTFAVINTLACKPQEGDAEPS